MAHPVRPGARADLRSLEDPYAVFERRYAIFCGGCQCNCRELRPVRQLLPAWCFAASFRRTLAGVRDGLGYWLRPRPHPPF